MKVIICRGLPASGKSTFAKKYVRENPGTIRINRDDLRAMIHDSVWSPDNEKVIVRVRDELLYIGLSRGQTVIIDDTNFGRNEQGIRATVDGWWHSQTQAFQNANQYPQVEVKSFEDVPLTECLKRNAQRANAVPEKVILDMYRKYIAPMKIRGVYREPTPGLPECMIFDMDGTLSIPAPGRDPRTNVADCAKDSPNFPILRLLRQLTTHPDALPLLIVSGREDGPGRAPTEAWLKYYQVPYRELHMRKTKDYRKDSIVKKEIFENEIAPRWNVVWVFDDRAQVVDAWRELGLCCLAVADGNF